MDKTNEVVKLCRQISELESALDDTSTKVSEKRKISHQIKFLEKKLDFIKPFNGEIK